MSKRINIYIRDMTYNLLKEYCDMMEYDMSRVVDDQLFFRLGFLIEERKKVIKKAEKEAKNAPIEYTNNNLDQDRPLENESFPKWVKRVTTVNLDELSKENQEHLADQYERYKNESKNRNS